MPATPATLTVPARPEYARLMRAVADAVVAGADMATGLLDDLELAVTEAAGAVMADGTAQRVAMELATGPSSVRCRISAVGDTTPEVDLDPVRRMVLAAITASHDLDRDTGAIQFTISVD